MKNSKLRFLFVLATILLLVSSVIPTSALAETGAEQPIPEGIYDADYMYLKDNTADESAANPFMQVKDLAGKIIVDADGNISFQHQLTEENASYMQYIGIRQPGKPQAQIKEQGKGKDGIVGMDGYDEITISKDKTNNYTVTYPLTDIKERPDILMHVVMEDVSWMPSGFHYDNWYNVQIEINTSNLPNQNEIDKTALIEIIAKVQEFADTYPYKGTTIPNIISVNEHDF